MKNQWISVKDRLPEESRVIVNHKFGVSEGFYFKGVFLKYLSEPFPEVTHWMPLPEPPKF